MTNITKTFSNVALVAMVAILFAGCSLLPGKKEVVDSKVMVDDPSFTTVSDDDSLDTIQQELDSTIIEDEDFSDLEAELEVEEDIVTEKY
jgi:PBP1b-binding outer membrane lipoprotein LpoB